MNDLVPPPEEPMDPATRARIRARLTDGTADSQAPGQRPWLLPLGAVAAVLMITVGLGYAAFRPGGDSAPVPGADPTSGASDTPAPTPSASTSPKAVDPGPTATPSEVPEDLETFPAPTPTAGGQDGRTGCKPAVTEQVDHAERVVAWSLADGEAGIWVAEGRWVLCEDSGGIATTHGNRPIAFNGQVTTETLRFSSSTYPVEGQQMSTAYVAGGPLPEGVTGIEYAFPGGHVQQAALRRDDAGRQWWSMGYVPVDGPLADPDRDVLDLDPVRVTVSLSGVQDEYVLRWGRDDCAQVNHGC